MNLIWTPLDDIIINLESTYGINSTNYISKLPIWIIQALAEYKVFIPLEPAVIELPIESNDMVVLPADVKTISALSYKDVFIPRGSQYRGFQPISLQSYSDMVSITGKQVVITLDSEGNQVSKYTTDIQLPVENSMLTKEMMYYVNNSRVLTVNFGTEGETVKLYYLRIPHSRDRTTGALLPMVPDNEVIKNNITWYILRNLLYSGYSHPVLNLGSAMPYLNPAKMYENTMPAARTQFLKWDTADYGKFKNLFTTFLHSYSDPSANTKQH